MGERIQAAYLDLRDVAAVLGVTTAALCSLARRGDFAPVLRLSRERAVVAVPDLEEWEQTARLGDGPPRLTAEALRLAARRLPAEPRPEVSPEREEGEDATRDRASLR